MWWVWEGTCFITGRDFCLCQKLFWFYGFSDRLGGGQQYFGMVTFLGQWKCVLTSLFSYFLPPVEGWLWGDRVKSF